jgi:hypothetical protein
MGKQAVRLFDKAGSQYGLMGKVRLASLARITSTEAESMDDTPELVQRLELAYTKLATESDRREPTGASPSEALQPARDAAPLLRRQLATFVELMAQRSVLLGDLTTTMRRITESASGTLDVERVSLWFLDDAHTKIVCRDLFVRKTRDHAHGTELFAKDFPPYFRALKTERTIAAHDAHVDPRTSCFSQVYLTPLGIASMLDVPIWVQGKMVGVVCHEHVGPKRRWDSDEETFAYLMSSFVALALERHGGA